MVISTNLLIISLCTASALIFSGLLGSKRQYSRETIETLLFFGTFILAVITSMTLGFMATSLAVGLPSLLFTLYYKTLKQPSEHLEICYGVAKEFVVLGLIISCLLLFSQELRALFNIISSGPQYFLAGTILLAVINIALHSYNATKTRYQTALIRSFYVMVLISFLMLTGVEMLFIVTLFITFIVKYVQPLHKRMPNSELTLFSDQYFTTLLVVALIRFFLVQPYQVPTGSLEPTIKPGDFLLVNQFSYGIRLPITQQVLIPVGTPARGDIVVFQHPNAPEKLIKRVVGLPGDHIVYKNKQLILNGLPVAQSSTINTSNIRSTENPIIELTEYLPGKTHQIQITPYTRGADTVDLVIPPGHYFMMGDNRDNSGDSRIFGPVSENLFIGKAFFIWMNWDPQNGTVSYERIGKSL